MSLKKLITDNRNSDSNITTGIFYGEIFFRILYVLIIIVFLFIPLENQILAVFIILASTVFLLKSNYQTVSITESVIGIELEVSTHYLTTIFNKKEVFNLKEIQSIKYHRQLLPFLQNIFTRTIGKPQRKTMDYIIITPKEGAEITLYLNLEPGKAEPIIKKIQSSIE